MYVADVPILLAVAEGAQISLAEILRDMIKVEILKTP